MKRIILSLLTLALSLPMLAQGQVSTRKFRLADFPDKMTQIVLSENEVLSAGLRKEVVTVWTANTFEFCTLEQFEKLKTSDKYYFLIPVESRFKGEEEPGITLLTLVKGGGNASKGIGEMHEVVSLPVSGAMGCTERDLLYLDAMVQGIQDYTLEAMTSEAVAYKMSAWFNDGFKKTLEGKEIYIATEDLSNAVTEKELAKLKKNEHLHLVEASQADEIYRNYTPDALVGYVIAPVFPTPGSVCYKLFFEADTHRLCYIERDKITEKRSEGFLPGELKSLGK
jgi:hypothetical protein